MRCVLPNISEDALIWAKVRKILKKHGSKKAIEALKEIRLQQSLANKSFSERRSICQHF